MLLGLSYGSKHSTLTKSLPKPWGPPEAVSMLILLRFGICLWVKNGLVYKTPEEATSAALETTCTPPKAMRTPRSLIGFIAREIGKSQQ